VKYRAGDRVRVAARAHEGHHRTPGYVKGKSGRVERVHGGFKNPETRAYGSDGLPEQVLYQVRFSHRDLWRESSGHDDDRTYVDIFEHRLEEAE
jgi:Nitrile hydratase beta subunit, C-terminal